MKILVTGGLGFIGSNLIRYLLKKRNDVRVTNLDSMSYGSNSSNLADLPKDGRYRFVKANIMRPDRIMSLIGDVDTVINLAAETHVDRSISSARPFLNSNVLGVFNLLEGLRRAGREISLVQVGTDEEYGEIQNGGFTENDALRPSSPYAATKASASILVLAYARTYGLNAKVTRCTNNFGPYQFPEKFIPKTIIRALHNLKVPVYGDGRNVRDWIHVEDHCQALMLVLRKGKPGNIYNVAGGKELRNIELVKTILGIMQKPDDLIEFVEDRPGHDKRYSLNDRRIRQELGWKPKHNFEDSLKETVQWYLNHESWWRPISDGKTLSPSPWKLKW